MNCRRCFAHLAFAVLVAPAGGCGNSADEPTAADKALDSLQQKYEDLSNVDLDETMEWATDDLQKIGDWEYRVLELGNVDAAELEAALNEAGAERWEVIWMEKTLKGHAIVMKRPAVSYLSKVPLSQIGRIVIGGSESEQ